jgi:hypothetical protein
VSTAGDNESEMSPTGLLDDDTIEAIVAGDEVDARFDQIVAFARHVQALGDGPPPPASPALEAMLAAPRSRVGGNGRRPRTLAVAAAKVAGLGLAAQVGLGATVAAAGVVAAGAGGVLPGPANDRVRGAIEAVTPIDFGGPGASDEPARQDDPDSFGSRVSDDATGGSDGSPGVDGGEISDEAPGAAHRPDGAGGNGEGSRGRDGAAETPAAPRLPDGANESDESGGSGMSGQSNESPPSSSGSDSSNSDDQPSGTADTPGATTPGGTAPGRTAQDPEATPSTTVPPPAPAATATTGSAGGGGNSAAQGG